MGSLRVKVKWRSGKPGLSEWNVGNESPWKEQQSVENLTGGVTVQCWPCKTWSIMVDCEQ